jgi:general secretion pathway protein D
MVMITNIVSKVDVLLAQVLIEGIVLAVNLTDRQELGVSWLQKPKQFGNDFSGAGVINNGLGFLSAITNFPSGQPTGFNYFGSIGQDIEVAVRAFASDGRVRILQRPRVQTSHAVPGYFFSGSTVPYVTGFYDYGFGTGVSSRSTVEQVEVGVRLEVIPYITPDGLVVLDIFQDISQLGEFVQIDQNQVPTTTSRNAQATLSVRDGETIILGGYIEDNRTSGKSGVPVLKDIPLLGALFRSKSRNNSRTELILLMHVTILKNPADAGIQADAEKNKMPGITAAEEEFQRSTDEKKNLKF